MSDIIKQPQGTQVTDERVNIAALGIR
jgi:hypothetical protein